MRHETHLLISEYRNGEMVAKFRGLMRDPTSGDLMADPAQSCYCSLNEIAVTVEIPLEMVRRALWLVQILLPKEVAHLCKLNRLFEKPLFTLDGIFEATKLGTVASFFEAVNRVALEQRPLKRIAKSLLRARKKEERRGRQDCRAG